MAIATDNVCRSFQNNQGEMSTSHGTCTLQGNLSLPLKSFPIVDHPVAFQRASRTLSSFMSFENGSQDASSVRSSGVSAPLDVIDIERLPETPLYWFYPPSSLGPFEWNRIKRVGKGHYNVANTCFLNATIQALAYCAPFAQDCVRGRHATRCTRRARGEVCGLCLFEAHLRNVFGTDSPGNKELKDIKSVGDSSRSNTTSQSVSRSFSGTVAKWNGTLLQLMKREIRMNHDVGIGFGSGGGWYGMQNCAHEWLIQFLDFLTKYELPPELEKEFERGRISNANLSTSYLHQTFSFTFEEAKVCQQCKKASKRYELNMCLRLPIQKGSPSLVKAIRAAFEPEMLTGSNRPMCEYCGVRRDKLSKRSIYRPPNILILLIQRTEFRTKRKLALSGHWRGTHEVQKNSTGMDIPTSLNLDAYLSPEARESFPSSNSYTFFASVNHSGSSGFGHYWAIVKGPDGLYYKMDDETRSSVAFAQLSAHLASSYLVFYIRDTPVNSLPAKGLRCPIRLYAPRDPVASSPSCAIQDSEETEVAPWTLNLALTCGSDETTSKRVWQPKKNKPQRVSAIEERKGCFSRHSQTAAGSTSVSPSLLSEVETATLETPQTDKSEAVIRHLLQSLAQLSLTEGKKKKTILFHKSRVSRRLAVATIYSQRVKRYSSVHHIRRTSHSRPQSSEAIVTDASHPSASFVLPPPLSPSKLPAASRSCPFQPEERNSMAKSLTTQYGCTTREVDTWDSDSDSSYEPNQSSSHSHSLPLQHKRSATKVIEEYQKLLAPKTARRSREDWEYDLGKTKKVKKAQEIDSRSKRGARDHRGHKKRPLAFKTWADTKIQPKKS